MACGPNCVKAYSEEYDSYYCETCNEWYESTCDDPTCEYCVERPTTPLRNSMRNVKLVDAVITLHNIARLVENEIGRGQLAEDIRKCADRLHECSIQERTYSVEALNIINKAKDNGN